MKPQEDGDSPTPIEPAGSAPGIEEQLGNEAARAIQKENRQVLALVLVLAAFMTIAQFTPLKAWITNVQTWKGFLRDLGWLADVVFVLSGSLAVMVGVPRLPLCAVAGLAFGFVEGLVLSLTGSTIGSYGAFLLARAGVRRAALGKACQWPWLARLLERPSFARVFWIRQLMAPGIVLNVLLGASNVRHRVFLAGTVAGYLPLNIAFSLVGSGLGKGSLVNTLTQLMGAIAAVNVIGWLVWRLRKQTG